MKYYFENETQSVVSEDRIKAEYEEFGQDYDTFSDYLSACMYWNNGTLTPIHEKINAIYRQINITSDAEEAEELVEFLQRLRLFEGR